MLNCVNTAPIAAGSKNSENQVNPTSTNDCASTRYRKTARASGGYLSQIRKGNQMRALNGPKCATSNCRRRLHLSQLAAAPDRSDHEHDRRAKQCEHQFVDLAVEPEMLYKPEYR